MQPATRKEEEMSDRDRKRLLKLQRQLCVLQDSDAFERLRQLMADVERILAKYRPMTRNKHLTLGQFEF